MFCHQETNVWGGCLYSSQVIALFKTLQTNYLIECKFFKEALSNKLCSFLSLYNTSSYGNSISNSDLQGKFQFW